MSDDRLSKRFWVIKNIDWLMDEALFHKDNHTYFSNRKIELWDLGSEKGEATLNETAG